MRMAPITGAGITDKRPEIFGKKPKTTNKTPAIYPIRRLVAPEALLKATLLAEVSDAMPPPSKPNTITQTESATISQDCHFRLKALINGRATRPRIITTTALIHAMCGPTTIGRTA